MASFIVQLTLSEIMSHFAGFFPEKCKLLSGRYEGCQKDVKKACRYSGNALKKINNDKSFFHMLSEFEQGLPYCEITDRESIQIYPGSLYQ